jgi:hypothetical protein
VENLILSCLEKDRAKRLSSIADLARRLAEFGTDHGRISAARAGRIAAGAGASSTSEAVAPSSKAMVATQISVPPRIPEDGLVPRLAIAVGAAGVLSIITVLALFASRGTVRSTETAGAPEPVPAILHDSVNAAPSVAPPPATSVAAPPEPVVSLVEPPPSPAASSAALPLHRPPPPAPPPLQERPAETRLPRARAPAPKPPAARAPDPGGRAPPEKSLGGRL